MLWFTTRHLAEIGILLSALHHRQLALSRADHNFVN